MLGRFLEYSIATPDIGASLEFYGKLGFCPAVVGEAWAHPYAVMTDGRIHIGLHQDPAFERSLTFVKPDLLKHLESLERLGVELEFRLLANDVFNEIGWFDPSGQLIRLVEARTFSPLDPTARQSSLCGYFSEVALPVQNLESAKHHWERLGFVGLEDTEAASSHIACTSDTVDIGLYQTPSLREAALVFEVGTMAAALSRFAAAGLAVNTRLPTLFRRQSAASVKAPEGTVLLLVAADDSAARVLID